MSDHQKAVAVLERGNNGRLAKQPDKARTRQAQIEREAKDYNKALAFQIEALTIQRGLNDSKMLAHVVRHMADTLQSAGRHGEAEPYYREMLSSYQSAPNVPPLEMANALRSIALHEENMGKTDDARHLWQDARSHYAALDAEYLALTGKNENPGVREADRHLATLGN